MKSNGFRYSFKVWLSSILLIMLVFQLLVAGLLGPRSDEISFGKLLLVPLPFAFFHVTIFCLCSWGFLSLKQTATRGWQVKMILSMFLVIFWVFSWLALSDRYTSITYFITNLSPPRVMKDFPQPYLMLDFAGFFAPVVMLICVWVFQVRTAKVEKE